MEASVEAVLVRAEKLALSLLSPLARSVIIALRALASGGGSVDQVRERCALYGFECRGLERALKKMEEWGLVTCDGAGCRLTEEGAELVSSLEDFVREVRDYAYSVARGSATDYDVYSHVATPLASVIGVVEACAEDPEAVRVALIVHAYVSLLTAAVNGLLARMRPELLNLLRTMYTR